MVAGFLPKIGPDGDFLEITGKKRILSEIYTVLVTVPGTRSWQPEFGCILLNKIFALNTKGTIEELKGDIKNSLSRWVPDIDIESVDIKDTENEANQLAVYISIKYKFEGVEYDEVLNVPKSIEFLNKGFYQCIGE